jgi:hypothetical protein
MYTQRLNEMLFFKVSVKSKKLISLYRKKNVKDNNVKSTITHYY